MSDSSVKIYGVPVRHFNARITRVYTFKEDERWMYECETTCVTSKGNYTTTLYVPEDAISCISHTSTNVFEDATETPECIDI